MQTMTQNSRINVLINLSSRLLCESLRELMEQDATTYRTVVAHALDQTPGFAPDKILVDAATLEQTCQSPWHGAKVILIDTGLGEDEVIRLMFRFRLDGVISTGTGTELFRKALLAIHAGQVWIDNRKIRSIIHNPPPLATSQARESFSRREREIVLLVAEGQTNRDIAAQLNISEQTVKSHISRIFGKASVSSRTQLAPLALKFKMESATFPPRG